MAKRKKPQTLPDAVAEARAADLVNFGDALAGVQGTPAGAINMSEDEQHSLWWQEDPSTPPVEYMAKPTTEGGMGLSQFQASMLKYPYRGHMMEAIGGGVDTPEAVAYAQHRHEHTQKKWAADQEAQSQLPTPPQPMPMDPTAQMPQAMPPSVPTTPQLPIGPSDGGPAA